jgi:hypothetical protein
MFAMTQADGVMQASGWQERLQLALRLLRESQLKRELMQECEEVGAWNSAVERHPPRTR